MMRYVVPTRLMVFARSPDWRRRFSAARPGAIVLLVAVALAAAGRPVLNGDVSAATAKIAIRGAGATFPAPLYEKWIDVYRRENPDVSIAYDAVGSGEGQRRFIAGGVDFGASDAALSDEQMSRVQAGARLIPVTAGMVVVAYNVAGLGGPLKLSRDVLPDIFAGRIRTWNDPRIQSTNPGLKLPKQNIAVVARLDGSGTTFAFTNHLSAISGAWRDQGPGVGTLVDWRGTAMVARGNEGVAARIKVSEGSLGYVEYHFAKRLGLPMAQLQNKTGRYIEPNERSGQVALAAHVKSLPDNLRLFLPDPDGEASYPIVSLSWLLLYDHYQEREKAEALKRFVAWGLTAGQVYSLDLGYIVLPDEVAARARAALDRIN